MLLYPTRPKTKNTCQLAEKMPLLFIVLLGIDSSSFSLIYLTVSLDRRRRKANVVSGSSLAASAPAHYGL
jgi:hypothetical protein